MKTQDNRNSARMACGNWYRRHRHSRWMAVAVVTVAGYPAVWLTYCVNLSVRTGHLRVARPPVTLSLWLLVAPITTTVAVIALNIISPRSSDDR